MAIFIVLIKKKDMKIEEQTKQFITITEEHKRTFEQLCRNLVKGQIKSFTNNCIYIEPSYNIGYTNSIQVDRVNFINNMEIEHITFANDNSDFNEMFKEIVPTVFYRDTHREDLSYRINFIIKEKDYNIFLIVIFNKVCNISTIDATYGENDGILFPIEALCDFELDEIKKKEEQLSWFKRNFFDFPYK